MDEQQVERYVAEIGKRLMNTKPDETVSTICGRCTHFEPWADATNSSGYCYHAADEGFDRTCMPGGKCFYLEERIEEVVSTLASLLVGRG